VSTVWRPAYVAVGSNLNSPRERVHEAFEKLRSSGLLRAVVHSRLYKSSPMGPQDQPDFVNAVLGGVTESAPRQLLDVLLAIERSMGRIREARWGPRVIDLDLVWVAGSTVDEPGITLPHPGVSTRNFVLYPLADIAPMLSIPGVGLIAELKERVTADGITVLE
jgi:2-amino-4-hydroxy-6-hydroxymethyldihydropteridine diphosphokinase